ncbi:MAG: polyketide synthase, partial [Desulfobacterales bacterium]|nr:polyketide synthase [Desulfobacterales bacterium]
MPEQKTRSSRPCHLILLSAPTRDALEYMREDLVERLRRAPDLNPADVAFTLQVGRERFRHRLAAVCRDVEEAISVLENPGSKKVFFTTEERKTRGVVLVFGETAANGAPVGKELYAHETAFR